MNFTFATVDVKHELATILVQELPEHGFPNVKVLKADPQTPSELPCVGINRLDDTETNQTISDEHGTRFNPDTQTLIEFRGTFFSESVELRVWHTNADERDKLYQAVKAIAFAHRMELVDKGLLNVSLRGGRDEQDSTMAQAPTVLYWSTITMTYLNPLNVEIVSTVPPITSVTDTGTVK